ncbi:MAG: ABC transporter permease subunit [Chloroflexi bacterium]|jgi:alpha-1,4-digalacturonate transport system permease protein|nr:ABC transporter permease subunit [Chloroflexota bacterium]
MTAQAHTHPIRTVGSWLGQVFGKIWNAIVLVFDVFFAMLQNRLGIRRMPYVFVLPNLLIFGIFILFPMLLNFFYSFTGGIEFFPADRPWVGTANFEQLLDCQNFLDPNSCREDLFWRSIFNTIGYVVAQVSLMVVFSLITALALNRKIRGRAFFRSVYFYPVLLSPIVVALIWKWILQENGLLNGIITGLGGDKMPFMVDATWARFWVVMISVWAFMGFYTLILLAGLQAIPSDVYEAADMDGANNWQTFWKITLPLLMPNMVVVLVLSLIRAVQVFDLVFAFTGGGPGSATRFIVQFIYDNGFSSAVKRYGIAASASLLMAGTLVILTLIQLRFNREEA